MRKIDIKKRKKKRDLMEIAYELFSTNGYENTSIINIALKAGVGKGTFYLYFNSKEELRDKLVALKASQLLHDSIDQLKAQEALDSQKTSITTEEKFIRLIDCTVDTLSKDIRLLKFISKNLSWGIFKAQTSIDGDEIIDFQKFIMEMLDSEGIELRDPELFVFTLLELVNSTCYSVIVENEPVSLDEYKPYLNDCIKLLLAGNIVK